MVELIRALMDKMESLQQLLNVLHGTMQQQVICQQHLTTKALQQRRYSTGGESGGGEDEGTACPQCAGYRRTGIHMHITHHTPSTRHITHQERTQHQDHLAVALREKQQHLEQYALPTTSMPRYCMHVKQAAGAGTGAAENQA